MLRQQAQNILRGAFVSSIFAEWLLVNVRGWNFQKAAGVVLMQIIINEFGAAQHGKKQPRERTVCG